MSNEMLALIKKIKSLATIAKDEKSLIAAHNAIDELSDILTLDALINIASEFERINNLEPVAYITQEAAHRMNNGIVSNVYVTKDKSPAFNSPIYIQK